MKENGGAFVGRPLRSARRLAHRLVPSERRIKGLGGAKGRGWLQLRKLLAPWFQRTVTLETADHLRLRVTADPVDEQIVQHLLGPKRGEYFPSTLGELPTGACILDVGAHHGFYAALALHTYPGARVICVEPSRAAVGLLSANLRVNGFAARARIVNVGLASARGHGELRHSAEGTWASSLYEDDSLATGSETVRLETLDEILGEDRPYIIKCNAEGAEYSLIEQLFRTDIRPAFMLLMVHPEFGDEGELVRHAHAMGYRLVDVGTRARPAKQMWLSAERSV